MENIKSLFKFENLLNSRKQGKMQKSRALAILSAFGLFCLSFAISFIVIFALSFVGDDSNALGMLSFIICIVQVILFFFSLTTQMKSIFSNKDKILLAYLPISKWQIYLAKSLNCLLNLFYVNLIITVPALVCFGIIFELGYQFFIVSVVGVILMPLLPFALANLVLVPVMYIQNWLKNKNILKLFLSVAATIVVFYFYSKFIFQVADVVLLKDTSGGNILERVAEIFKLNWIPSTWFANFLSLKNLAISLSAVLSASFGLPALSLSIGALTYKQIFNKALVEKNVAKAIKTKTNKKNKFWTYFILELKDLFRSSSYSYTYFGMAIAMPIMVWFCNNFILSFAVDKVGESIIFGTTLLVVLIFASIICSPTASFISKEGDNFWILKTNPNGIKIPLLAKSMVGVFSSVIALVSTFIVIVACGQINIISALTVLLISLIYVIGLIAMGLIINLQKPNIFFDNKENNTNMVIHMFISFIMSVCVGVASIIFSYSLDFWIVSLVATGIVLLFSGINVSLLFAKHAKFYARIEV